MTEIALKRTDPGDRLHDPAKLENRANHPHQDPETPALRMY